jgi:hypothetical protein
MTPQEEQLAMQDYVRQRLAQSEPPRDYKWYLDNPPPPGTPVPEHLDYVRKMQEQFDMEQALRRSGQPGVPAPVPGTVPITPGTLSPDANPKVRPMRDYRWGSPTTG